MLRLGARRSRRGDGLVGLMVGLILVGSATVAFGQDAASPPDTSGTAAPAKKPKHKPVKAKPVKADPAPSAAAAGAEPAASPAPSAPVANPPATPSASVPPAAPRIAARLTEAGASTCAAQVEAAAAGVMGGVAQFNTASHWAKSGSDKRLVTVVIGQKYPEGGTVPAAATNVVASPNAQGTCDAVTTQVVPSPTPCAQLNDGLVAKGLRHVADLAGVAFLQDGAGNDTMLVPTAANTCVVVGTRVLYAP